MFRFFVDQKQGQTFILPLATLKHLKVARIGSKPFICIYKGQFYQTHLEDQKAIIEHRLEANHELPYRVVLAMGIIKFKRFEWLIQKATELGASEIIPLLSTNVVQKMPSNLTHKLQRWNEIAKNAAEQSFRNQSLKVLKPQTFAQVLTLNLSHRYLAHEQGNHPQVASYCHDSLFLIGPEGGFTAEEVQAAQQQGFQIINLGPRILRSETAGLVVLSRLK